MKKLVQTVAIVLGITAANVVSAQNYSNDPTYSPSNYKQPNKAAKMKAIADAQPEVYVQEVNEGKPQADNSLSASANYKGMATKRSAFKRFFVSDAPEAKPFTLGNTNANYKNQFPGRARKVAKPVEEKTASPVAVD